MQFFRYLYHNVPDLISLWMSPEFLCALAATVFPFNIRPYSEMVGNPAACLFYFSHECYFWGFINYQSYQDKALLTCTRGHHQGWAGCFVLGLWIWEKSVSNCRAVVMQGHQKQHFWGNKQFACFLVDIIFNRMKMLAQIYSSKRDCQLSALEDVMKSKTSFSSHFPFPFLVLWLNHKAVFLYFL